MKIFYSWQSDLENKLNRGFIKKALEQAIKNLNVDLEISEPDRKIELDHDTKNIPGTPDLAGTIFEKIASSTVFIADISFVAERLDGEDKTLRKVANPNVLIELGYALSKLGSDRVLCVLNTSSGSVDNLPFDLKHKRHPIQYQLDSNSSDKSTQKDDLSEKLKEAIRDIVNLEEYKNPKIILSLNPSSEEIMHAIMASDSKDDWESAGNIGATDREIMYYKKNISLRFESSDGENYMHEKNFREQWANEHPDPSATSYVRQLFFISTRIASFVLVSVDGGRALLPLPKSSQELVVSPLCYKIAKIHDILGTLDQYMNRSGLRLQDRDLE